MKNNKVAILVDSCNDISEELTQKYGFYTMPLVINYKDRSYKDRVDITPQEVYDSFKVEIPKTSLPLRSDIDALLDQIKADGYDNIIASIISSGLSGTYQSMHLIADDRDDLNIEVINTLNIGIGSGFVGIYAAELLEQGLDFDTVVDKTREAVSNSSVIFGLETLEYLMKGGRIGKVSGILGSALKIKPIISCNTDGIYDTIAKVRGRKQSINKMMEIARAKVGNHKNYYIALCHGDALDEMLQMKEELKDLISNAKIYSEGQISPVLGVHTGPGLLGIGVMILED
ncbi:DegV family protein [Jeotgalibaca porci]|jgi:DegV family protein with EDD domain|uniref:DegV family protein n=1 Tax=Jeotgalibaca porci TaxID=1868793 RepID=A0A6G7WGW6_9LACT|nr:DegV family protein [Jeotgalibaca porci]NLB99371.1 DegV family protein [Lactobacillales bacterium]QIK51486.1 DegV family protein [Jeotgalibaca porci]